MLTKIKKFFINEYVILVNVILFTCLTIIEGSNLINEELISSLIALQWVISMFFVFEIAVKIEFLGLKGFFSKSSNIFDFFVIFSSFLLLLFPTIGVGSLTCLRLVKLLKIFRLIRFIPNGEYILKGVVRAIKASRAIFGMLFIMLIIFAMVGFSLFSNELPEYFGTPISSMYTVFSIFTVENWNEIPQQAISQGPITYYLVNSYVIFVLVIGGFLALSLANAVFVDEMVMDNNDELYDKLDELYKTNNEMKEMIAKLIDEKNEWDRLNTSHLKVQSHKQIC